MFNCGTTCDGIYADVEWVENDIEVEVNKDKSDETMDELEGEIDDDLKKMFVFLQSKMKLMENKMKLMENKMKMALSSNLSSRTPLQPSWQDPHCPLTGTKKFFLPPTFITKLL